MGGYKTGTCLNVFTRHHPASGHAAQVGAISGLDFLGLPMLVTQSEALGQEPKYAVWKDGVEGGLWVEPAYICGRKNMWKKESNRGREDFEAILKGRERVWGNGRQWLNHAPDNEAYYDDAYTKNEVALCWSETASAGGRGRGGWC